MSCELLDCAGDELELRAAGDVEVYVEPVGQLQLEAHPHQVGLLLSWDVDDEPEEEMMRMNLRRMGMMRMNPRRTGVMRMVVVMRMSPGRMEVMWMSPMRLVLVIRMSLRRMNTRRVVGVMRMNTRRIKGRL